MTLLNDLNGLQKPDNNYALVLYPEAESYESLKNALTSLISDLSSSDWKFLSICLEIKAANAQHFCPWCDCSKDEINTTTKTISKSMDEIRDNYNQIDGHIKKPLFFMMPLQNWVCDELHIFLRITDRLWELMLSDLRHETTNEEIWKEKILLEMQRLKITFQFWHEKNKRAIQIQNQFNELYLLMQNKQTTGKTFHYKAQTWLNAFLAPSKGHPNRSNFIRGMYQIQDITPYIHVLVNHVAEFIEIHHEFGLTAFSCSAVEKKNHIQVCLYFRNTLKEGDMRIHENLQL
ncbi:hypothetical protein C1646_766696 [Rhizophagus diaphanus]|nr:hypothetical protein C1646_766696 [Rhizophagus diaphanus] [Rhizophagus sp. MUCL 43196]